MTQCCPSTPKIGSTPTYPIFISSTANAFGFPVHAHKFALLMGFVLGGKHALVNGTIALMKEDRALWQPRMSDDKGRWHHDRVFAVQSISPRGNVSFQAT